MSRLIDKLKQASQAVLQPMGFRAAQAVSQRPKILLIASLVAQPDADSLAGYVAGADAGLLPVAKSSLETFLKVSQAVPDIPWGGWLRGSGRKGIEKVVESGFDFVVFPAASTSLAMLQSDNVGRVLQVEASLAEGLLRAVDELPVDAVFISSEQEEGDFLTWRHLMIFRCFAGLLTKPLLASVPLNITPDELLALWDAGIDGVVVDAGGVGGLKKLRQAIDKLTFPQRKQGKREVLLPQVGGETAIETEEE